MRQRRSSKRVREPFWRSPQADLEEYRRHYPSRPRELDDPLQLDALFFYSNLSSAAPAKETIDEIHEKWADDFDRLELTHNYIQWLFPLQEPGINYLAPLLQKTEIELMRDNVEVMQRVVRSFQMMLRFYGMELEAFLPHAGVVRFKRLDEEWLWQSRYNNLRLNTHNFLRITRILKFLGEMGLEFVKIGWLRFLIDEVLFYQHLPECRGSLAEFWVQTVYNDTERDQLLAEIAKLSVGSEANTCAHLNSSVNKQTKKRREVW